VWKHSPPFRKWSRRLPPEQFEIREVLQTRKGPTLVGLFSKDFVRAERRENQGRLAATRRYIRAGHSMASWAAGQ
jgi:hypothetical protein